MPKLTIDEHTRLLQFSDLVLKAKHGGRPIDFARDHLVILGPDQQPVAECWPIDRDAKHLAPPVLAVSAVAVPRPGSPTGSLGPLTEAQRESLQRLWADNPKATVDKIGDLFEKNCGRSVSAMTVLKYKP